jgi:threonine dehydrogenase-like Zn-dependent dehydrogenase
MQALQYIKSIPRYLLIRSLGQRFRSLVTSPLAPLRLVDLPQPAPPGPEWVVIRTHQSGICGSDLATLTAKGSPYFSPLTSFPFVLGHELTGELAEVGPKTAGGWRAGDRVTLEPALSCAVRGISPPCGPCRRGHYPTCENIAAGALSPGPQTGYCRDTGGGWSEYLVAHPFQLHRLPEGLSQDEEILVEPFSCALHAALKSQVRAQDQVLIIGAGAIGLLTLAALRLIQPLCRVTVLARYPHQAEVAGRLGADYIIRGREEVGERLCRQFGAKSYQPELGKPVVLGGADLTFDCVASGATLDDALRYTRSQGRVVVVGMPAIPRGIDWTALWHKEIEVVGTYTYCTEEYQGRPLRTFALALEYLQQTRGRLDGLVGARFPLSQYRRAVHTALATGRSRVVKTAFDLRLPH